MITLTFWQLVLVTVVVALSVPFVFYPERTLQKLRKKRYQYEVTFGLYMLTPTEKFILNSFLFLTFSMITLASLLYLPSHIRTISNRVLYYYSGSFTHASYSFSSVTEGVSSINNAIQNSWGNATTDNIYQVSQRVAESASEMAKGLVAAAAGQAAQASKGETGVGAMEAPETVAAVNGGEVVD